jgi:hypothetical protein
VRRRTNRDVVNAFIAGERGQVRHLATDGTTLFSYMLPIARRDVHDHTIHIVLKKFVSTTTTWHLRLAGAVARHKGWHVVEDGTGSVSTN